MLSLLKQINKELEVKVIIVILGLVLGSAANAQQWFSVNANCSVNAGNIQCTACNYSYNRAISCRLDARAVSAYGYWMNQYNTGTLYPGNCMNVYIYANNPYNDPIVNGSASAQCRF